MANTTYTPDLTSRDSSLRDLVVHRNRAVILAFDFLWGIAMPAVSITTLLPGFFRSIGIGNMWIGLIIALSTAVSSTVQPFSAFAIKPNHRRLRKMRRAYLFCPLGFLLLGIALLSGVASPMAGLGFTMLAVVLFYGSSATGDPHYSEMVVAAVDEEERGRYFAIRALVLGAGGILGGVLASYILRSAPPPTNFGWSFLIGALLVAFSSLSMKYYRDPPVSEPEPATKFHRYLWEKLRTWGRDRDLRNLLISSAFVALAVACLPFLGPLIKERLHESDRIYGVLGSLSIGSNLVLSWLLGAVVHRWGSRRALYLSLLLLGGGLCGCLYLHDRWGLLACYLLASIWGPAQIVAGTDFTLKVARDKPLPEVFAIKVWALAPVQLLGPILLGSAIDHWQYEPVIIAGCLFSFCSLVALTRCREQAPTAI
jgi:MFS family permease